MQDINVVIYSAVAALGGLMGFAILLTSQKEFTVRGITGSFLLPSLISFAAVALRYGDINPDTTNRVEPLAVAVIVAGLYGALTVPQMMAAMLAGIGGRLGVLVKVAAEAFLTPKDKS